jgi:polar amino acid transport system permease protein
MTYTFRFRDVWAHGDLLIEGALLTLQLSAVTMALGLMIGILGALLRAWGPRPLRWLVAAYVEVIRNTPLLVQLFLIFFGLPSAGIRLTAGQAAVIAMVINLGAYATEIVRAGIEAIHKSQIEAGLSLGLSRLQVFRYVVLFPALAVIYPALASQFILVMLATSIVSQISAQELFYMGAFIESRTFRSFEVYLVVTGIYLLMALFFRAGFAIIHYWVFRRPRLLAPAP